MDHTLGIVKPNSVASGHTGKILSLIEGVGFSLEAIRLVQLSQTDAESFYAVHRERPFYQSLVNFMTSGPVVPMALQGENAVQKFREVIGDTDPNQAEEGTVRQLYGESKERNTIHGSDSDENARIEIEFFFPEFFGST